MAAGELCDAVARDVMGWQRGEREWAYSGSADVWLDDGGTVVMTCFEWQPDADDAQAMTVLDRLVALGFAVTLATPAGDGEVAVTIQRGSAPAAESRAANRRLALLGAALQAVATPVGP